MDYSIDWDGPGERDREPSCACPHFDRCECANMRMRRAGSPRGDEWDACDCKCHDEHDDEMDMEDAPGGQP
jgi:hypothetical protein